MYEYSNDPALRKCIIKKSGLGKVPEGLKKWAGPQQCSRTIYIYRGRGAGGRCPPHICASPTIFFRNEFAIMHFLYTFVALATVITSWRPTVASTIASTCGNVVMPVNHSINTVIRSMIRSPLRHDGG